MVETPWGNAASLRERKLAPGARVPADEVARSQRERLFGAMVASTAERGYEATSVADLLRLSGVSRSAFYRHFANREECFLATLGEILAAAGAVTASRMRRPDGWEQRARSTMATFTELLVAQPAAARLCLVEAHAAGPRAVAMVEESVARFERLVRQAFEERPEYRGMPEELTRAMVGGLRKILHTRLHRGTEVELVELMPDLLELGLAYRPPPKPLRRPSGRTPRPPAAEAGDAASRIVRGTMTAVAERGYQATTVAEIAAAAGASLSTFYEHFDGKEQAFDAALYSGRTRMLGVVLPAFQRARTWPEGVRTMTQASIEFLASEPEFARLVTVDVYAAGSEALERRDRAIEAMQQAIEGGFEYAPETKPIAREAVISAIYSMLCDWVRHNGAESLPTMGPLAIYTTLCPFLGPEQACEVANGARRR